MKIEAIAHIDDNGNLNLSNRRRFKDDLKHLKGCDVEIQIKKRGRRTSPQNRYYWSCVVDTITRHLLEHGNETNKYKVHAWLKHEFNPEYIHKDGEVIGQIGGSTTELNKDEMADYLDRIIRYCNTELELIIPEAGVQTTLQL